jgi:heterodisulfide reductase subunit B
MKYAYYPGCSLHSAGSEFDISMKEVCARFGMHLEEINGWICCGTTAAHSCSRLLSLALPLANLSLVEAMGMHEVVAPCASCFARLKAGHHETAEDPELLATVNGLLDRPYQGTVKTLHPLEIFSSDEALTRLRESARKDLSHVKAACYYGCLLTRPPKVKQFDQHEYPMTMDRVLGAVGIRTLDWDAKTMCCGAAFSLTDTEIVYKLTGEILEEAKAVGANAIAVACPLCHANLDMRQAEIEEKSGREYKIPIFYFTQLMGLALGIPAADLAIGKHLVSADALVGADAGGTPAGAGV